MKIVIDISEKDKKFLDMYKDNSFIPKQILNIVLDAVKNGTPLPKGHGRLIDAGKLKMHYVGTELGNDLEVYLEPTIENAPTIIEADKEQS